MVTAADILRLAEAFAAAKGIALSAVSSRVFDDSKKLAAIEGGADLTLKRAGAAMQWFSNHWPDSAEWPADLARPTPTPAEAAE